jgi:large subunit ribosomal protein L10
MARPEKVDTVEKLTEKMRHAKAMVLTDYRGLTVAQLQELRAKLRAGGVDYLVVKNTLARRAATAAGLDQLPEMLNGPVALALSYEDVTSAARLMSDYIRLNRRPTITAGLLGGQRLKESDVAILADAPPKEILIARLLGTLQSPLAQLASVLQEPVARLARALQGVHDRRAGAATPP